MSNPDRNKEVDEEISQTLGMLSSMEKAEPTEGFYNRVLHRMHSRTPQKDSSSWLILWPQFSYMVAGFILILLLNALSIGYYLQNYRTEQNQLNIEVYVQEYTDTMPSLYQYESNEEK